MGAVCNRRLAYLLLLFLIFFAAPLAYAKNGSSGKMHVARKEERREPFHKVDKDRGETMSQERKEKLASRGDTDDKNETLSQERKEKLASRGDTDDKNETLAQERKEKLASRGDTDDKNETLSQERKEKLASRRDTDDKNETLAQERKEKLASRRDTDDKNETLSQERKEHQEEVARRAGVSQGFHDGFEQGRSDARTHRSENFSRFHRFKNADHGFKSSLGSRAAYEEGYRQGFRNGYDQGFDRLAKDRR